MSEVILIQDGFRKRCTISAGMPLMPLLQREAGFAFPCGGNHICGKCRVRVSGGISEMTPREHALLRDAAEGERLACFLTVLGDCEVVVGSQGSAQIVTDADAVRIPLDPGYMGFGAAFDIGTTTVACYLFSSERESPLASLAKLNRQASFGADVISRIEACKKGALLRQRDVIRNQMSEMLETLCGRKGVVLSGVQRIVATGNTVMLHLLAGFDPLGLAAAPFTPESLFGGWQGWKLDGFPNAQIYLPDCISAFVGADITCSILASGMLDSDSVSLLLDIGTNGEMALFDGTCLTSCSVAAGPAFEGAGISCGSGAVAGAISMVRIGQGGLQYEVIGGGKAHSICGSGLIDAAAAFLSSGALDETGLIADTETLPIGDSGLSLTQQDIRQLQLAKAAVAAGMETLLHERGIGFCEVGQVFLCGGFGSYLDAKSAARIGLLPKELVSKTKTIGNAAGAGAGCILQSHAALQRSRQIAQQAKTIDLSVNAYFMERYIENMLFQQGD